MAGQLCVIAPAHARLVVKARRFNEQDQAVQENKTLDRP